MLAQLTLRPGGNTVLHHANKAAKYLGAPQSSGQLTKRFMSSSTGGKPNAKLFDPPAKWFAVQEPKVIKLQKQVREVHASDVRKALASQGKAVAPIKLADFVTPDDVRAALDNASRQIVTDSLSAYSQIFDRKMSGPCQTYAHLDVPGLLARIDRYPRDAQVPEGKYKGEPKSHVDAHDAMQPVKVAIDLDSEDIVGHVRGKPEDKKHSPLTSWLPMDNGDAVVSFMHGWGQHLVVGDPKSFQLVLDSKAIIQEIRYASTAPQLHDTPIHHWLHDKAAFMDAGKQVDWQPHLDPMLQPRDADDARDIIELMVREGIDPTASSYSRKEQLILWNARQQEHLSFGASQPGGAQVIEDAFDDGSPGTSPARE